MTNMREIKFRAFEHNLKEMIEVDDIQFYRGDDIKIDGIELKPRPRNEQPIMINTRSAWRIADGEDVTLMQYTGLKDKNGKEIYEGDVVCWVTDVVVDSEGGFNRTEPEGQIGKVEFSNGAFWVNGEASEFYSYGEQNFLWSELQIIGNIYENPELLKND